MTAHQNDPGRNLASKGVDWAKHDRTRPFRQCYSDRVRELSAVLVNLTRLVQSSVDGLMYVPPDQILQQMSDALGVAHELMNTLLEDFDGQTT